jgi:tyrosine-protein phosphatase YwqE
MTNWAYGITVALTLTSGIAMLMASSADNAERRAVEQRQVFDQLSEEVESERLGAFRSRATYVIKKIRMCCRNTGSKRRPHRH